MATRFYCDGCGRQEKGSALACYEVRTSAFSPSKDPAFNRLVGGGIVAPKGVLKGSFDLCQRCADKFATNFPPLWPKVQSEKERA